MEKIKRKIGAVSLEAVIAIGLILPILFSFIFGGYNFYMAQAENVNFNFNVGRFLASMPDCSESSFALIGSNPRFSAFEVQAVIDGVETKPYTTLNPKGVIRINCASTDWKQGYIFYVYTSVKVQAMYIPNFYPEVASKGGYYEVE